MADQLDQQVRIEYQGTTVDPTYGPQPGAWIALDTVWASVIEMLPAAPAERGAALRVATKSARVRIRYRNDVNSSMRVVLVDRASRLLRIVAGPAEVGRREYVDLMCEEFTTEGDGP